MTQLKSRAESDGSATQGLAIGDSVVGEAWRLQRSRMACDRHGASALRNGIRMDVFRRARPSPDGSNEGLVDVTPGGA